MALHSEEILSVGHIQSSRRFNLLKPVVKGQVQWAIAGRSEAKLLKLKEQLVKIDESCKDVPVLTADLGDPKSLDRLVKQSDVLISTAGPFWSIGYPVVRYHDAREMKNQNSFPCQREKQRT